MREDFSACLGVSCFVCGIIELSVSSEWKIEMVNKIMEWHYFSVPDDYTGLDVRFRWREALCGYCGTDYQFQVYSGLHGRWVGLKDFIDLDEGIRYCNAIDFRELYKQLAYI